MRVTVLCCTRAETALLVIVFPVVLGCVGCDQPEVYRAAIRQLEAIVGEVLAAFGVVLILVGPMQHHLFPRVGMQTRRRDSDAD